MDSPDTTALATEESAAVRRAWFECGALGLLLVLAAALRIPGLFQGFWGDEVYTMGTAAWPMKDLLSGKMVGSSFAPLAFLVVRYTVALFPPAAQFRFPTDMPPTSGVIPAHLDEWVLRMPFFVMGLVTVLVLFLTVRRHFGFNAAFWAGLFLAVSPEHIGYSTEIRYYGMLCLAGALLLAGTQRLLDRPGWAGWVLTALALLLGTPTHLTFALVIAGVMGAAVISLMASGVSWRRRLVVVAGLAAMCMTVAALQIAAVLMSSDAPLSDMRAFFGSKPAAATETAGDDEPADRRPPPRTLPPSVYFVGFIGERYLACHGPACAALLAVVGAAGAAGLWRRWRSMLLMIFGVILVPAPLFFIRVNYPWWPRYFICDILLCAIIIGAGMDVLFRTIVQCFGPGRRRAGVLACAALVAVSALTYAPSLAVGRRLAAGAHGDGGLRQLSRYLADNMASTDRVLFLQPFRLRWSFHVVPYNLVRMRPDWQCGGMVNQMLLCRDVNEFKKVAAAPPRGGFWVVSFDNNNRDVRLNDALAAAGAVCRVKYPAMSLWRIGGAQSRTPNLLADKVPGIVLPPKGVTAKKGVFRVVEEPEPGKEREMPTILFPVARDGDGQPANSLKPGTEYVLRFRLQLEGIIAGANRARTFRVMLFAKEGTADLMLAEGTAESRDYTFTFTPGEYLPETLTDVKIGFGIRGGTGAFRLENVTLQGYPIPTR